MNKRGQSFYGNFLMMVLLGILLFLGTDNFIAPIIANNMGSQSLGTQILMRLIIPTIYFIYILIFAKVIRRGDGGVGDE